MIPKILHYCWYGDTTLLDKYKYCLDSWYKIGWDIRLWNEKNTPKTKYYENCYSTKNFVNIANLLRIQCLSEVGGVYVDTDVQVVKDMEPLLNCNCFLGFESKNWLNNAIFGMSPGFYLNKILIEEYLKKFDGTEVPNMSGPRFITPMLKDFYGIRLDGSYQKTEDGTVIYPREFFYPYSFNETYTPSCVKSNTYCIHHWMKSWINNR